MSTGGLHVEVLRAGDREAELGAFFEACPKSVAQQTPAWRDAIMAVGEDEPLFLACLHGDAWWGVLPAYRFDGPCGAILTSVPQAGPLGGVACANDDEREAVYSALIRAFVALARERDCALATLLTSPFWPDRDLVARHLAPSFELENACLVLDLRSCLDDEGEPISPPENLRRNLKRARNAPLRIDEEQSTGNVEAWYAMHADRHREIGAAPLPRALIRGALEHAVPRGAARFFFVRHDETGEMVAGGLYLRHGAVVDAFMPALRGEYASLAPSYLLALHTQRWARASGAHWYNWQASPPEGGVARFKRQWGSREHSYAYLTRVTGDARAILASTPQDLARDYAWHYVLPYDRLGPGGEAGGTSSRAAAWRTLESGR